LEEFDLTTLHRDRDEVVEDIMEVEEVEMVHDGELVEVVLPSSLDTQEQ
jgi:hypothetical protein